MRRGLRWSTDDGMSLDILAPTDVPLIDTGDDVNENSIVTRQSTAIFATSLDTQSFHS